MKRFISIFGMLLLMLVLLCSCSKHHGTEPEASEAPAASDSRSEAPSFSNLPKTEEPITATERPVYTGEPLIKLEPEARVYIGLANQDCDLYPETYFGSLHFYIITLDHYAARDIQVEIPMQTKHSIRIDDITDIYRKWEENGLYQGFSYYDYMCMRGTDWKKIYELRREADEKLQEIEASDIADCLEKQEKREAALKPYNDAMNVLKNDFEQLTEADLPEFCVYNVNVSIDGFDDPRSAVYEETVDHAQISIGGKEYKVNFGEWRLHKSLPKELKAKTYGIQQKMIAVTAILDSPYNGGYVRLPDALYFTASKDLTITGVRFYGNEVDVLGAHVQMDGVEETGAAAQDFYWDMDMPLDVSAGQTFKADIYIRDDRFKEYEVNMSIFAVMDYELDGRECSMMLPCSLERLNNCSETYLLAFGAVDIGEFKHYFYVPFYESYLFETPESWKR